MACDRAWHAGLWQVLRSFNIDEGLVQAIQAVYENSSSGILLNSQLGKFFKTTAGCLLLPVLFNLFVEKIMQKTLHDHHTSICIGWKPICNLRFADDIGFVSELQGLINRLVDRVMAYGIEVSTEKSKIMTNSMNNTSADISMKSQKLEEVTGFKYLGATLCKDGTSSAEVCIRIAPAMAATTRLNRIWRCNTISFASKFKVHKSLVASFLFYGCETWTLLADSEKRTQAFKTKCLRKLLRISYT